ncbi:MAG TPA: response regulator, partial [Nitrospirota bacterium]
SLAEGLAGLHAKRRLNVVTADNGKKAIQMLRTALFDAVLTDLNLPVLNGYHVLDYLSNKYPNIPVIVMTALDEAESLLQRFNIRQLIEKPVDFRVIANAVLALRQPKQLHAVSR